MATSKGEYRCLLGLMLSVLWLAVDSAGAVDELKCELITVSACQNLVYNMTVASAPITSAISTGSGSGNSTGSGEGTSGETGAIRSQLDAELLVSEL